jgi:serine phosphatase RsbU (regulator of sigma subunit)
LKERLAGHAGVDQRRGGGQRERTMLELKDFYHLPQLDELVEQLVSDGLGLVLVAGLDPRPLPVSATVDSFLPSGRAAIFRILMRQILEASQLSRAIVVAESKDVVRLPRALKGRVEYALVQPPHTYAERVIDALRQQPDLLVIDQIGPETVTAALEAAQQGVRVLSQIDTVFRGAEVARALLDLGASPEQLSGLGWVVAVQRLATLCSYCKEPLDALPSSLVERLSHYPDLVEAGKLDFYRAVGCPHCQGLGRQGVVTVFDVFRAAADAQALLEQPSLLPLEEYVLRLAAAGYLQPDDALRLEPDQLRRTYHLLAASERVLIDAKTDLERKLVELEAANRVLQQRTEALISLQEIGQALISAMGLEDLAQRVCRHVHTLCGADRAVLYFLRSSETAEILAVNGWNPAQVDRQVEAALVIEAAAGSSSEPVPFAGWPPGIRSANLDVESAPLRAGLRMPLVAQGQSAGAMIVHATQKAAFAPGEVALLQTYANQAALAIQRAGLIQALRENIDQLQTAQAELVKKERLEQELELARQVQQSMLPRIFPLAPGYAFAARNAPARRVGGDFYDVISLDAARFGLVIGDVSDKGMPAALYMALTRSLLLAEARRERSPAAVLKNVHHLLLALGEASMFVTVFYGVVDVPGRRLTYARAGHDLPLLLREEAVEQLGGKGMVLGLAGLGELGLSEEQLELAPGDRLVLYTDGLTDTRDENGRLFGQERFKATLKAHTDLAPVDFCAAVFADATAFQGGAEQYDDMTLLVVEVR